MTCPSSLLYKVYRAKYIPHSSFANAKIGSSPSYTWHGLFEAQKLILKVSRLRVGNKKFIDLWRDYWLQGQRNLAPLQLTNSVLQFLT